MNNLLLHTDVYKLGHMLQYPEDTEYVYSYLEARKLGKSIVWFGLDYYLNEYLKFNKPTFIDIDYFKDAYESILGTAIHPQILKKLKALSDLGYWPLKIKALPEGQEYPTQTPLMTITNTLPGFGWCVGYLESLLLKVWYPTSVATLSRHYYNLAKEWVEKTCDSNAMLPYMVHDFGYRGASSEETAAIGGAAHLLSFRGSDNVPAFALTSRGMSSIPASEHSVMCAYGRDKEWDAFDRMLDLYPDSMVSIVSDTYDYFDIITRYATSRKDRILARKHKVVFRPDSGDPIEVICGNPLAPEGSPERKGSLQILWEIFGGTINSKGYKQLNPCVGLIYGDGMYYQRYEAMLKTMAKNGFAVDNLVIGVGGILLQNHSRDDYGFAIKATHVVRGGMPMVIYKDPATDPGKRSKRGLLRVNEDCTTDEECTPEQEAMGLLKVVFENGNIKR